jgi:hypothetical protein
MKAQNRHDTIRWKKKRKNKFADGCNKAQCTICHSDKVIGIPSRKLLRENAKFQNMIRETNYG